MSLKTKVLLTLICTCIPTFAMADGHFDWADGYIIEGNTPNDLDFNLACATSEPQWWSDDHEDGIQTEETTVDEDGNKVDCDVYLHKWDDIGSECSVYDETGEELTGTCQEVDKDSIYEKFLPKVIMTRSTTIWYMPEILPNNKIVRCKVPGYEPNSDGFYVKKTRPPLNKLPSKFDDIDAFFAQNDIFKKSDAWTDKDGNFNTARLVSDSVAVVVLGTVGGVITSNIIKKNQLKNGLETLKCTIGGQDVADYGDEFDISVQ